MELCIKQTNYKPLYMADATSWTDIIEPGSVKYFDHSKTPEGKQHLGHDPRLTFIWSDLSTHIGGVRYYDANRNVHGIRGADFKQPYGVLTKKAKYVAATKLITDSANTIKITPQSDNPNVWLFSINDEIGSRWLQYLPAFELTDLLSDEDAKDFKDNERFEKFMRTQTRSCEYSLKQFLAL